jgi:hypothetical protein
MEHKPVVSDAEMKILKQKLKDSFPESVSMSDMIGCVTVCMTLAGSIKKISGESKKELVIELVLHAMEVTDAGPLEVMEPLVIVMLPQLIDSLISVENGKIKFNPKFISFFSKLKLKLKSLNCKCCKC